MVFSLSSFPQFRTGRLLIRKLSPGDRNTIFRLRSDEQVNRFLERPIQKKVEEADAFIEKIIKGIEEYHWFYWTICLHNKPMPAGTICLWNFSADKKTAEIGYELLPEFQGRGIMREAIHPVMNYAFCEIGLHKLEAFSHKDNLPSVRLLEKIRFMIESGRVDPKNKDHIIYSLVRPYDD
jgi:ribosomal-protein-alanine N-acetyltransferase